MFKIDQLKEKWSIDSFSFLQTGYDFIWKLIKESAMIIYEWLFDDYIDSLILGLTGKTNENEDGEEEYKQGSSHISKDLFEKEFSLSSLKVISSEKIKNLEESIKHLYRQYLNNEMVCSKILKLAYAARD